MAIEPEQTPARTGPTYADLEVAAGTMQRKDLAMVQSVLKTWRSILKLADDALLGPELTTDYPDALATFCEQRNVGVTTRYGDRSRMGAIRELAVRMLASADVANGSFAETLDAALTASDRSVRGLAKAIGIVDYRTIGRWRHGETLPVHPESRVLLAALEKELGLLPGTLSRALPETPLSSALHPDRHRFDNTPFGARIQKAIADKGWTVAETARQAGISEARLYDWVKRRGIPGTESRVTALPQLAKVLGLSVEELMALVPEVAINHQPFSLRTLSAMQQREWDAFKEHKTDKMLDHAPESYWRIKADESCPSADKWLRAMRGFWGWMTESLPPSGEAGDRDLRARWNVKSEEVGLLDLAREGAVEAYIKWHAKRKTSGGNAIYTMTHENFLVTTMSIFRKKTGYLWHAHTVDIERVAALGILKGATGGVPTKKEWREHCKTIGKSIKKFLKKLKKVGFVHRDARAHLQGMVSQERPMDVLDVMVHGLAADIDRHLKFWTAPAEIAAMERDLLLLTLICDVPMRLGQWMHLTYKADNTGHLRRAPTGVDVKHDYEISIPQSEMKKPKLDEPPFEAKIAREHTPLIEKYLFGTETNPPSRALLAGGKDPRCHLVFRPMNKGQRDPRRPFKDIAERVLHWSEIYLAEFLVEDRGFRTHALRHIIATHFVKKFGDPIGIHMAALILDNSPEMIREHYGFLTSKEKSEQALTLVQDERRLGRELRSAAKNPPEAAA